MAKKLFFSKIPQDKSFYGRKRIFYSASTCILRHLDPEIHGRKISFSFGIDMNNFVPPVCRVADRKYGKDERTEKIERS
jgi:hypothetical protein